MPNLYSFCRYARRFGSAFLWSASWGRDQLIGAATIIVILLYQLATGEMTVNAAQAEVSRWAPLTPHLFVLGIYVVVHGALTAWRLDKGREDEIGLPIVVSASFQDYGTDLVVTVRNRGPRLRLQARITSAYPIDRADKDIDFPLPVRWQGLADLDVFELESEATRFIDLLKMPTELDSGRVAVVVYSALGEHRSYLVWDAPGRSVVPIRVGLHVVDLLSKRERWIHFYVLPIIHNQTLRPYVFGDRFGES